MSSTLPTRKCTCSSYAPLHDHLIGIPCRHRVVQPRARALTQSVSTLLCGYARRSASAFHRFWVASALGGTGRRGEPVRGFRGTYTYSRTMLLLQRAGDGASLGSVVVYSLALRTPSSGCECVRSRGDRARAPRSAICLRPSA